MSFALEGAQLVGNCHGTQVAMATSLITSSNWGILLFIFKPTQPTLIWCSPIYKNGIPDSLVGEGLCINWMNSPLGEIWLTLSVVTHSDWSIYLTFNSGCSTLQKLNFCQHAFSNLVCLKINPFQFNCCRVFFSVK